MLFQRKEASLRFPPRRQIAPESLLAGYHIGISRYFAKTLLRTQDFHSARHFELLFIPRLTRLLGSEFFHAHIPRVNPGYE